jgi:hypothetical protein
LDGSETPESIIKPYLGTKERLTWTGRPAQGLRLSPSDAYLIPFSLVWCGFVTFWNFGVWTQFPAETQAGWLLKLWGVPFLLVGLYMMLGRFLVDAWARSRTVYGLTGQRAIVVRRLLGEQVLTAPLDHSIQLKRRGQAGDLEFGFRQISVFGTGRGMGMWNPALGNQVTFLGIPDAMDVYRRAQAMVDKADPI